LPSLAAHSADRPSHAPRHLAPRRMRATRRRTPSRNAARRPAAPASKNFQPRMKADERRCRRDRLLHQAGQPLQFSYPRSSAFIRGKIILPSPPTRPPSHTSRARATGPRAPRHPQGAPTRGPTASFKPFRTDPLNREPTAKPATSPYKPFRTDPLNREPMAKPGSTALPARAQDPAPRPGQSGEGSKIRGVALDLASFTRLPCRPATRFSPRPRHRATLPGLAVLPGGNHNGRTRRAAPARPHHY
jgi:hypothetical protein